MKVGLIVRADKSGVGFQTRRLARLLSPDKVMVIDSTKFNGNYQHYYWYEKYKHRIIDGFPTGEQVVRFVSGLDVVISAEMFYNNRFTQIAKTMKVNTICVANPEFFDWFRPQFALMYPRPDKVIVPTKWMMDKMKRFDAKYLPTPIFDDEFKKVRESNLKRSGRNFLFMQGKTAVEDRNGLKSLYEALPLSKGDYSITIKSQSDIPKHPDPRLVYNFSNPENQEELYEGFDCLIQPRRYGGQTLSMCEALTCAMPVIMTDISPNDDVLPKEWLVPAKKTGELMTRTEIDVYSANPAKLAYMLDNIDLGIDAKKKACAISKQYHAENIRSEYEKLIR